MFYFYWVNRGGTVLDTVSNMPFREKWGAIPALVICRWYTENGFRTAQGIGTGNFNEKTSGAISYRAKR